jgi:prepilin signal peptidase PulO-like enzyme (type II secretory pathway)
MEFILLATGAGILGAILGSFLNALLFRYNTGRSVLRGRSRCMHCGRTLNALDLVPVLSYLALRGKCRYCHSKVSIQYPLVEIAGVILAALVYLQNPDPFAFALWLAIWMTLLFVFVYDLKHKVIPWEASGLLAALALLHLWSLGFGSWSLVAGPILAAPLFLLSLVSGGRWMGWGDSALELGLGWMLGVTAGLSAFVFAFWTGAVVGIGLLALSKGITMKSEVPFAPFLIAGAAIAYFCNVDIFQTLPALFL